jgi:transposase
VCLYLLLQLIRLAQCFIRFSVLLCHAHSLHSARVRHYRFMGRPIFPTIVLILDEAERFSNGKKLSSYLGLVPSEESSGEQRGLLSTISLAVSGPYDSPITS